MPPQLPRTAQPPPPLSSAAAAPAALSAIGPHALAYSVTTLMAAELKRLLADKRRQRQAELEARLAAERRALAERRSFDLSVGVTDMSKSGIWAHGGAAAEHGCQFVAVADELSR